MGCSSQARAGQVPGSSQTAESAEPNPSPALFQNHHVAVAESAVIGYPHEIKGEGETLAFLHPKYLSWAVAMQWEIALSHQPLVAMLCQHPPSEDLGTAITSYTAISWALHEVQVLWSKALTAQGTDYLPRPPAEMRLSWH